MEQELHLPYGKGELTARLPQTCLTGVYAPRPTPACADPLDEIERALAHPLDTPPLSEIVRPGEGVVILIDDHTRSTPTACILPPMLEALHRGGVAPQQITILITHGTHRLSSEIEVRQKVGDEIYRKYRIEQHRCDDEANQIYVGLTSRGTPVWLNRLAVEAERRIGIGHIGPSPYAGYSGGYKLLLPGVSALDTINANHSLVPLGFRRPADVSVPCRLDIEEAAALLGLDLLLDVVLNQDEQIARAFAGTPMRVFREGLALARQVYEVACPGGLDAAITAGYPYDLDLYQAVRAVEYADIVVRPGGSILLAAACPDGVGGEDFYRLMSDASKKPEDYLRDVARRNGAVTFGVLGYSLARIKAEKRLYLISEGISSAEAEAMGFSPLTSLQEGVDALLQQLGREARMGVFPMGASTIPVPV